jgi:hypothetical protein
MVQEQRVVNAEVVQAGVLCPSCQVSSASSARSQTGYSDVLGGERFGTQLRATDVGYVEETFVFDLPDQRQVNQQGPSNFPTFYWEQEDAGINQSGALGVDPSLLPEANALADAARAQIQPADHTCDDLGDGLSLVDIDELFSDMEAGAVKNIPRYVTLCEILNSAARAPIDLDNTCFSESEPTNESFFSAQAATDEGNSPAGGNLMATSPVQPSELPTTTAETGAVVSGTENTQREITPSTPEQPTLRQLRPRRGRGRPKRAKRGGAKTKPGASASPAGPTILPDVQTPELPEIPSNDDKSDQPPEGNKENEGPSSKREGSPLSAEPRRPGSSGVVKRCRITGRSIYNVPNYDAATLANIKEERLARRGPRMSTAIRDRHLPEPEDEEEPATQEEIQPRRSSRLRNTEEKTPEKDK